MRWLEKIRESPNYPRLKNSVELKRIKFEAFIFWGITAFIILLMVLVGITNPGDGEDAFHSYRRSYNELGFVLVLLVMLVASGYYIYRIVEIFLYIDRYTFTEVLLNKPHQGYKGSMYFTVTVRDRHGKERERDTRPIFSQGEPNFEEYNNQKVLIGYNEETDIVVVIQKLP